MIMVERMLNAATMIIKQRMIIKIILGLFLLSILFFLMLMLGEKYALENKHPKFTKWWRNNMIGEWRD
jgi:hypothetical protein